MPTLSFGSRMKRSATELCFSVQGWASFWGFPSLSLRSYPNIAVSLFGVGITCMDDCGCFSNGSFQYVPSPYRSHDFVASLTISANLVWRLTQEVANPDYLHVSFHQSMLSECWPLKPVQRHAFYNNLVLECAKILALQPSIHFRTSCLCACSLNSKL